MTSYLINIGITGLIGGALFLYWLATRKRIAADTIGRAREEADRVLRDAQRESETLKKEALLEAKEKAHDLRLENEKQIRERRDELAVIEQSTARRDAITTEQRAQLEDQMRALRVRQQGINERERAAQATAARFEQPLAER